VDVVSVLVELRCGRCGKIFYLCERAYHGQVYCGPRCRGEAARATKARHQGSEEGRLDHRDAMRAHRERRRFARASVTDTRTHNLSTEVSSCVRDDAIATATEAPVVVAEGTDDGPNHGDGAASSARNASARDGRKGRVDAGDPGPGDGEPPAGRGDAARSGNSRRCPLCCVRTSRPLHPPPRCWTNSGLAQGRCITKSRSRSSPTFGGAGAAACEAGVDFILSGIVFPYCNPRTA
jgi:hypothetical protein